MEYRGFEIYATKIPKGLTPENYTPKEDGKVFSCEIYVAGDDDMVNVLEVFDLVEGKDIPVASEEALISELKSHVDKNYEKLIELVPGNKKDTSFDSIKAQVLELYDTIAVLSEKPGYKIAVDMTYLLSTLCLDNVLSNDEAYVLASKLDEAHGSWFAQPILHQEYLVALGDLLENGITAHNNPDFSELSAEDTLRLLLGADNMVFGTLVESAAVENCYRYLPNDYQVDKEYLTAVENAIETTLNSRAASVDEKLAEASEKVVESSNSRDKESETLIDR